MTSNRETSIITIEGRDYTTVANWCRLNPGLERKRVADAIAANWEGLADHALRGAPHLWVYPIDLLSAWTTWYQSKPPERPRRRRDLLRFAEKYDVPKMRVLRALRAGHLTGTKDASGWYIDDDTAAIEQWVAAGKPGPRYTNK